MKRILLLLLFPLAGLSAQGVGGLSRDELLGQINTITTAVPFLRISPDARAGGMGDGSLALSNDANAMYWNVSRLAFNKHRYGFGATYVPWLRALVPDLNLAYVAAYFKPDSVSAVGISGRYFSFGSRTYITPTGVVGHYYPREFAVDAGYSRKLTSNFSAGVSLRYIQSDIAPLPVPGKNIGKAYAADVGFSWVGNKHTSGNCEGNLQAGLAVTNIGSKMKYDTSMYAQADFIPINLGLSTGSEFNLKKKHFFAIQIEANKLLVPTPPVYEIDPATGAPRIVNGQYVIHAGKDPNRSVVNGMLGSFNDAPGGVREELREIMLSAGVEYDYKRIVKARTGFFYEHALKGNRKYVTFGLGVRYRNFAFDVSYLQPVNAQRSPLQRTMKFTLLIHWNKSSAST